jgi:hypothetical protein
VRRGFVLEWRKVDSSGMVQDPYAYTLFRWLCRNAAIAPCKQVVGRQVIELERGQVFVSRPRLVGILGWEDHQVRRALEILDTPGFSSITRQKVARAGTVVTVENFDTYNQRPDETYPAFRQRITNDKPTPSQHLANAGPTVIIGRLEDSEEQEESGGAYGDAERMAKKLRAKVREADPQAPLREIRHDIQPLLRLLGQISVEDVGAIIDFAWTDDFWQGKLTDGASVERNATKLRAAMKQGPQGNKAVVDKWIKDREARNEATKS